MLTLLFAASTAMTVAWCTSMPSMDDMPMPGGWTLSMMWMPMGEPSWWGAALSFLGMWTVMMIAMMLPSLAPVLWRCHQGVSGHGAASPAWLAMIVGVGYFVVWAALGALVFSVGAALASFEMAMPALAREVPLGVGVVVLLAGALQFTRWKSHSLACCRREPERVPANAGAAWRHGLRHGLHCVYCCAGLTSILLAWGVMNLRAMMLVTLAITAERLVSAATPMVRTIGATAVMAGLLLVLRALGAA
ncbi:DUF2182 domain-containing protein [Dyella japonica]|uniref:Membrane protein n=1 Tax=Dyella japonica A8 TaxID=1217721 RepID=A0A075K113_9GAMM|nr:DUF2182 domain-containing protein [Dyella japonica]AIF45943.1 membrane protein [Dyella japonica A8]